MYKEVLLTERLPEMGVWVTMIDTEGNHRVYRRTEHGYNMRDSDGLMSPSNNLAFVCWLEKVNLKEYTAELKPFVVVFPQPDTINSVAEFHKTFNHPILPEPAIPAAARTKLRVSLIQEELNELKDAIEVQDLVEVADALCDLQYVLSGAILEFGMADKFSELFAEVHRSNMSKACKNNEEAMETEQSYLEQGVVTYSELVGNRMVVKRMSDQKILKNINYSSANLKKILQ